MRKRPVAAYATGLGIFLIALVLRLAFGELLDTVPFITFLPAVLVTGLLCGVRVGVLVAVMSGLVASYLFMAPAGQMNIEWPRGYLALLLFAVVAALELFIVKALNSAVDRLADERDRSEVLFRELQHRVANNMAFIASLLRMQRRALATNAGKADVLLEEAEKRLTTMGRIHRRLYDPSIVTTPLASYLGDLARDILDTSGAPGVKCVIKVPPVAFDLSRLVTLSLLVTEMLTNSVKHGFADRSTGTISIHLGKKNDSYVLVIADDGRGMSETHAADQQDASLGMTIIRSLATQLGGEITWASTPAGTTATLVFAQRGTTASPTPGPGAPS